MSNSGRSETQSGSAATFPPGVDWGFIAAREGAKLNGYVPLDGNGNPAANSGVTIAVGFDLGGRSVSNLQSLGLDQSLIAILTPYLGLRGSAAQNFLTANPLTITSAQRDEIDAQAFSSYYSSVAANYNAASDGVQFQSLAQGAQTAIVSVAYQYGINLAKATPNFWRQVVGCEWQAAYNNLMNFGDAYPSRRQLEAAELLTAINSGTLPTPPQGAGATS
jgi:hypothetical protein